MSWEQCILAAIAGTAWLVLMGPVWRWGVRRRYNDKTAKWSWPESWGEE